MNVSAWGARHPFAAAAALVVALTVFVTWPHVAHLGSRVVAHDDPLFSTWRIAWIAHALKADPAHLYDANIFHPEPRTLAYSDATILEGAVAAPLLWAGTPALLAYNLLLLGGIAASGFAMFVLARSLTGSIAASLVAATIFTVAPYRVEHIIHLELQWTMWIPLAFWAVHETVDRGSWRFGMLTGVFLWLQILSCVYYGVYLAAIVAALAVLLLATDPRRFRAAAGPLALGAIVAAVLAWPAARPYLANARALGGRDPGEITTFSAHLLSYATWPPENWVWGWTAPRFMGNELRVSPGLVATALAAAGLLQRPKRIVWMYAALVAIAVTLSLGMNAPVYRALVASVPGLDGLRAPARFAIIACAALAIVSAFGVIRVQQLARSVRAREWIAAAAILLVTLEGASFAPPFWHMTTRVPDVYLYLENLPPAPFVELPMPSPGSLPRYDAWYEYFSTMHWRPLVNGYSGYHPPSYLETIHRMQWFPDDQSIARLRELGVGYVIVHEQMYANRRELERLLTAMVRRPELVPHGSFRDWVSIAYVFELKR